MQPLTICGRHADGRVEVRSAGWQLTLVLDPEGLAQCVQCRSPQGVDAAADAWQRYGTNPVDLLSIWERAQLERLLAHA
ncbi:hypothetical protein CCOS865_01422 [Pseudomonas reidholzensis]|uniref:DUF7693 domain-containing protein n=1 Tax=Pseudomonas reidholzensis TaxID=1785162 RepID=A0A383RQ63_9PSED|nr:hypothetical protein [Pseudomonas reidholzensis]SYX89182.1 hypothetical protein CCOS865_01422 [Pseudomonas reidholzensis]